MLGTDMKVAETPKEGLKDYTKADPYEEWLEAEGVKVHEEFYFPSSAQIELGPWERKGGRGAVIHIANRHMPNDCHVVEIKPGGKSEPEHHMYELTIYVVSGRGATTIWQDEKDEKRKQSFEWSAGSLFSIPFNARYQNFNGSGDEPARYVAVTNAPPMMRLFRANEFLFKCDWQVGSMVIVPSDNCYHQHFNSGTTRARYLALRSGDMGVNSPRGGGGEFADRSMKEGGWQIEYEDEDRDIHQIFEKEIAANGATCRMKAFVPWCTGEVGPTSERDT